MPIDRVVINASPLICLYRSQLQHLLPQLFQEIMIPDAVWREVTQAGKSDPAAIHLHALPHAKRMNAPSIPPTLSAWDLGAGETEVIALASQQGIGRVMMDDRAARRCAATFGLKTLGTLGMLVMAKRRGIIDSTLEPMQKLKAAGLWISDDLMRLVLSRSEP